MRQVSDQFPFVEVTWQLRGLSGSGLAFLDTGFDGFLMLPEDWFVNLGAPDAIDWWRLADGGFIATPAYRDFVSLTGVGDSIRKQNHRDGRRTHCRSPSSSPLLGHFRVRAASYRRAVTEGGR